jgi:hypothetical protein
MKIDFTFHVNYPSGRAIAQLRALWSGSALIQNYIAAISAAGGLDPIILSSQLCKIIVPA